MTDFESILNRRLAGNRSRRETPRRPLPVKAWIRLGLGSAFTPRATLGMRANSRHPILEQPGIEISAPLPAPIRLRVLYLTDLHLRGRGPLVDHLLPRIADLEYDLALLGGDFAGDAAGRDRALDLFRQIDAPLGAYAVPGNHDRFRYTYPNTWRARALTRRGKPTFPGIRIPLDDFARRMQDAGVRLLRNENVRIGVPGGELWLLGLDDAASWRDDLRATLRGVPAGALRIMLTHSPDAFPAAAEAGIPLVLAGHTHGGQILLPKIGALIGRTALPLNPPCGLFAIGDSQLYISRGAGAAFPFRINCPPEITLIDLCIRPARA